VAGPLSPRSAPFASVPARVRPDHRLRCRCCRAAICRRSREWPAMTRNCSGRSFATRIGMYGWTL